MHKKSTIIVSLLILVLIMSGCSSGKKEYKIMSRTGFAFDTVVKISIYENGSEEIMDSCFSLCSKMEKIFSTTLVESELYKVNNDNSQLKNAGKVHIISNELRDVVKKGLYYSELSEGNFDISMRPITSLWDFNGEMKEPPQDEVISKVLPLINYKNITLDENKLYLNKTGTAIDLGAVAKGYIADKLKELLISRNVTSAVISLGGNILCVGKRPDGTAFHIGIQAPFSENDSLSLVINIDDLSVVTSGIYERCFTYNNRMYHHIINPNDGFPYDNELASVTIISESSVDGDALSTTLYSIGEEKGMRLIKNIQNTYAVFVRKDGSTLYSEGFPMELIVEENTD